MSPAKLHDMTVAEVMERWPDTVQVFNRRRMACPGCVMAPFMTVADAAGSYEMEPSDLAADLAAVMMRPCEAPTSAVRDRENAS